MNFSVVIITWNEEKRIEALLASVRHASEIVVVDSMSTDGTVALCEKYGARVISNPFEGYGEQKQKGVDAAQNDWILSLDADEVPDEKCWEHLRELCINEPEIKAWRLKRQLVFMGRVFRYGSEANDRQLRFFDRRHARWNTPPVHEKVVYDGPTGDLQGNVAHESYGSLDNYFGKFNRYTSLAADQLHARNKRRSSFVKALGVPMVFFRFYFLKGNIMNGYAGFCWSLFSSLYTLVKYSKADERLIRRKA